MALMWMSLRRNITVYTGAIGWCQAPSISLISRPFPGSLKVDSGGVRLTPLRTANNSYSGFAVGAWSKSSLRQVTTKLNLKRKSACFDGSHTALLCENGSDGMLRRPRMSTGPSLDYWMRKETPAVGQISGSAGRSRAGRTGPLRGRNVDHDAIRRAISA